MAKRVIFKKSNQGSNKDNISTVLKTLMKL